MHMACLDNIQAYNHQEQVYGLFVIIKDNTLKYIWTCVIWVCYHQNLYAAVRTLNIMNNVYGLFGQHSSI